MANTLFISEFANGVSSVGTTKPQFLPQPSVADQTVAIGGASAASAKFNAKTNFVLLVADASCSIAFNNAGAADPVATVTNLLLPANVPMIFGVQPGAKVAVIANS